MRIYEDGSRWESESENRYSGMWSSDRENSRNNVWNSILRAKAVTTVCAVAATPSWLWVFSHIIEMLQFIFSLLFSTGHSSYICMHMLFMVTLVLFWFFFFFIKRHQFISFLRDRSIYVSFNRVTSNFSQTKVNKS